MVEKKGLQNSSENDPFDIEKISDISSDEESILSGSSMMSEIIPTKAIGAVSSQFGSMLSYESERKEKPTIESTIEEPPLEVSTSEETLVKDKAFYGQTEERIMLEGRITKELTLVEPTIERQTLRKPTVEGSTVEVNLLTLEESTLEEMVIEGQTRDGQTDEEETKELTLHTSTGLSRNAGIRQEKKVRPGRMCCFCKKVIQGGKLKRHLFTHKTSHDEVSAILKKTVQEQNKWIDQKRTEGMYLYNMAHLDVEESELMRERKPKKSDSLRMCLGCKRFFSNRTFYKHKENCVDNTGPVKTQSLQPLDIHKDSDFVLDILDKFRDGDVGSFIRENKIVQAIGYKHFLARKAESSKVNEVRREVMMEMRELTRLFLCFQSLSEVKVTFEDMYKRGHLSTLKEALNKLCKSEEGEKYGLKVNFNSIFQRSIKILSGYYAQSCLDSQIKELSKFKEAYNFNLPEIVGKARYHTEKNSLKKARLPKNLPIAEDMLKLKIFIGTEIDHIVSNFSLSDYTRLRSLVVARLTLYNARRGEEGSRLLLEEWVDAVNGTWVPKEGIEQINDDAEKYLVGRYKLAYMAGKGRKCVPVLIPVDLMEAIKLLISNREAFGIDVSSPFLFATKSSKLHCSGWHAVSNVCNEAGVSVNATKNRHRASTVYTSLDMKESDRKIFFDHLGHDESINKENYQCPQGLAEIRVMGPFLDALEDGIKSITKEPSSKKLEDISDNSEREDFTQEDDMPNSDVESETRKGKETGNEKKKNKDFTQQSNMPSSNDLESETRKGNETGNVKKKNKGSFHWNTENTILVREDFRDWVQLEKGNKLPSKKYLEEYLQRKEFRCSLLQLRTKIMNEQNRRRKIISKKIKKLQNQ